MMRAKLNHLHSKLRGFTLLEAIITLSVIVSLLSLGSRFLNQTFDRSIHQAVAKHMQQVSGAAHTFVLDHFSQFNVDNPPEISFKQLKKENYLPSIYNDTNLYQQGYHIQVFPDKIGGLLLLTLTTKGKSLPLATLLTISQLIGSQGGYIDTENKFAEKIVIQGQYRQWQLNSSDYSLAISPEMGHLATLQFISPQEVMSTDNFLWRQAVDGHKEYNQMQTDLQMGKNFLHFDGDGDSIALGDGSLVIGKEGLTLTRSGITAGAPEVNNKLYDTGYGSQLQRNWLKLPYYELKKENSLNNIRRFADTLCYTEEPRAERGRLFMLGRPDEPTQGIYACGQPDGRGLGPENPKAANHRARAYLIATVGDGSDSRDNDDKPNVLIGFLFPQLAFVSNSGSRGDIPEIAYAIGCIIYDLYRQAPKDRMFTRAWDEFEEKYGNFAGPCTFNWHEDAGDKFFNDYNNHLLPYNITSVIKLLKNPGETFLEKVYTYQYMGITVKRKNKVFIKDTLDNLNEYADLNSLGDKYKYKKIVSNPPSAW